MIEYVVIYTIKVEHRLLRLWHNNWVQEFFLFRYNKHLDPGSCSLSEVLDSETCLALPYTSSQSNRYCYKHFDIRLGLLFCWGKQLLHLQGIL